MKRVEYAIDKIPGQAWAFPRVTRRRYTQATYTEVEAAAFGQTFLVSVRHRENKNGDGNRHALACTGNADR